MLWAKKKKEILQLAGEASPGSDHATRERRASRFMRNDIVRLPVGADELHETGVPSSLSEVLRSATLRHHFRQFLRERHASESLLFYESIEMYQNIHNEKWRTRAGEGLVAKFIVDEAAMQVNLGSVARNKLMKCVRFDDNTFDEAKAEAYDLLKMNFFAPFVAREFLRDAGPPEVGETPQAESAQAVKREVQGASRGATLGDLLKEKLGDKLNSMTGGGDSGESK